MPSALVAMIAVPGAGKTTFVEGRFTRTQIVNLDTMRALVSDDQGDQTATRDAVAVQDLILDARCRRRLLTVVDATNLHEDVRGRLIARAREHSMFTVAVVLDTPLEVCLRQNAARQRRVPDHRLIEMHDQFTASIPAAGPVPGFDQTVRISPTGSLVIGSTPGQIDRAPWLW